MIVKNVVKVMNFHSLLRVNEARRRVERAQDYENRLRQAVSEIVNNRIFRQENLSLNMKKDAKELNIYIGSDFGFCADFNAAIKRYLAEDEARNDKIIVGNRIKGNVENLLLFMSNEEFHRRMEEIDKLVLDGVLNDKYSKVNVVYMHYFNMSKQEVMKKTILPFLYDEKTEEAKGEVEEDFVVEGSLRHIIWNLVTLYASQEIYIANAWSWASENVKREAFTSESLKKIEDIEAEEARVKRKKRRAEEFLEIVNMNNAKILQKRRSL